MEPGVVNEKRGGLGLEEGGRGCFRRTGDISAAVVSL